jgi:hypothetical protein
LVKNWLYIKKNRSGVKDFGWMDAPVSPSRFQAKKNPKPQFPVPGLRGIEHPFYDC